MDVVDYFVDYFVDVVCDVDCVGVCGVFDCFCDVGFVVCLCVCVVSDDECEFVDFDDFDEWEVDVWWVDVFVDVDELC